MERAATNALAYLALDLEVVEVEVPGESQVEPENEVTFNGCLVACLEGLRRGVGCCWDLAGLGAGCWLEGRGV